MGQIPSCWWCSRKGSWALSLLVHFLCFARGPRFLQQVLVLKPPSVPITLFWVVGNWFWQDLIRSSCPFWACHWIVHVLVGVFQPSSRIFSLRLTNPMKFRPRSYLFPLDPFSLVSWLLCILGPTLHPFVSRPKPFFFSFYRLDLFCLFIGLAPYYILDLNRFLSGWWVCELWAWFGYGG